VKEASLPVADDDLNGTEFRLATTRPRGGHTLDPAKIEPLPTRHGAAELVHLGFLRGLGNKSYKGGARGENRGLLTSLQAGTLAERSLPLSPRNSAPPSDQCDDTQIGDIALSAWGNDTELMTVVRGPADDTVLSSGIDLAGDGSAVVLVRRRAANEIVQVLLSDRANPLE
jgi:hypothetical protein